VAVVAGTVLDPRYGALLTRGTWFADEQLRVHKLANLMWPRWLGFSPAGMAWALSLHWPYRWRLFRCRRDDLVDVIVAVGEGFPVPLLIGNVIPRHWVLLAEVDGDEFRCYEPSAGEMVFCSFGDVRHGRLDGVGYPRPFAFVVPRTRLSRRRVGAGG
jgi:hypothetical protein